MTLTHKRNPRTMEKDNFQSHQTYEKGNEFAVEQEERCVSALKMNPTEREAVVLWKNCPQNGKLKGRNVNGEIKNIIRDKIIVRLFMHMRSLTVHFSWLVASFDIVVAKVNLLDSHS